MPKTTKKATQRFYNAVGTFPNQIQFESDFEFTSDTGPKISFRLLSHQIFNCFLIQLQNIFQSFSYFYFSLMVESQHLQMNWKIFPNLECSLVKSTVVTMTMKKYQVILFNFPNWSKKFINGIDLYKFIYKTIIDWSTVPNNSYRF